MAYALALQSIQDFGAPGEIMLSITIIYALFTILGIGSILNPILQKCDVLSKPLGEVPEPNNQEIQNEGEKKKCCSSFKKMVQLFNQNYFSPIFVKSNQGSANSGLKEPYNAMDDSQTENNFDEDWNQNTDQTQRKDEIN